MASNDQNASAPSYGITIAERKEQEQIIASLCTDAPNNDVRNCLRKYSPDKSTWQIEAAFKQVRKSLLVETLTYLGVPDSNIRQTHSLTN